MSIELINTLKAWFQTGDEPTEAQFAALIDSMMHRTDGDGLDISRVVGLSGLLNTMATQAQLDAVLDRANHSGVQGINTITDLESRLVGIENGLVSEQNSTQSSLFVEETDDYILTRQITNSKLICTVKLKALRDINQLINIVLVEAGSADWFHFQTYRQVVDTDTSSTLGTGSTTEPPTVLFNKLIDNNHSEVFGISGRGLKGRGTRIDGYDSSNSTGSASVNYNSSRLEVDLSEDIVMTIDKTISQEIDTEYSFVIEAVLGGVDFSLGIPSEDLVVDGGSPSESWGSVVVDGGSPSESWT